MKRALDIDDSEQPPFRKDYVGSFSVTSEIEALTWRQNLESVFSLLLEAHYLCPNDPHCNSLKVVLIGFDRGFVWKNCSIPRQPETRFFHDIYGGGLESRPRTPFLDYVVGIRRLDRPLLPSPHGWPKVWAEYDKGRQRVLCLDGCYPLLEKDEDLVPSKPIFSPLNWIRKYMPKMMKRVSFEGPSEWQITIHDTCIDEKSYFYRIFYQKNREGEVSVRSRLFYGMKKFQDEHGSPYYH